MTIPSSTNLGRYEVRSQLGADGMGAVYRGAIRKLNREVAIKVLPEASPKMPNVWPGSNAKRCARVAVAGW